MSCKKLFYESFKNLMESTCARASFSVKLYTQSFLQNPFLQYTFRQMLLNFRSKSDDWLPEWHSHATIWNSQGQRTYFLSSWKTEKWFANPASKYDKSKTCNCINRPFETSHSCKPRFCTQRFTNTFHSVPKDYNPRDYQLHCTKKEVFY